MDWESIKLDVTDSGVAVLTFNRPEQLNSVNEQLCQDVPEACKLVGEREDIKLLVITGAGKGWSSGGDVSTLYKMTSPINSKNTYDLSTSIVKAIYEVEKPVIAAVNGVVAGAALASCMACDLIIASDQARFGFTFMQLAFCPDSGASYFLAQKVGYHKAAELLWFGKILDVNEANQLGLVNKVVPHEDLMKIAMEWAEKIVRQPLLTVGLDKKLLRAAFKNDFYQQCELEALNQVLCWSSDDFKEGCQAFAEKRKPNFKGK